MKLSEIAKKPKLVIVTIDDPEVVQEFGEPLEFILGTASLWMCS